MTSMGFWDLSRELSLFVTVETNLDVDLELGMKDLFSQSMIQKVIAATSLLSPYDVPIVMTIRSLVVPSAKEVAEFAEKVSKSLENSKYTGQVAGLYAEVSSVEDFMEKELKREHEQIFPLSRRELLTNFKTTLHDDIINAPTVFPTNPGSTPPGTLLPDTPAPAIVTVPATNPANPVTVTPTNPVSTPLPFPLHHTFPGAQPVTNPVTTYPAPAGNVPVTAPVTNPVAPPATTNAPAIPGQSWCVARSGVTETALQLALDYACGMGGADCSQIQQGGNCFNPNSLQNHASFAFNSYYQKNPAAASCDFGGTATVVNVNPSTSSCIYPVSSSSSGTPSLPAPTTSSANPATTSPAVGMSGTPSVLNSSTNPASSFGFDTPPILSPSASNSANLQPFIGCAILITSRFQQKDQNCRSFQVLYRTIFHRKKKLEGGSTGMNYNTNILITFSGWPEVAQNAKTLLPKGYKKFLKWMIYEDKPQV
ncbi:GLUCAN ENDO-13-BETA-GLUCOSIDASE BG1-RELATED-RELATED [Salix purpurea]|uniref:GLUCAN ENDO-13-BETA-GLUCOSIDASE BG1-RELATED-RELATED n=1 Tax=Salix purpurea TaxID=77065 RepID=A0A9Q0W9I2_SALPP|nr:GLUCAN ENDO-13-BETA-GLUCOSIDASE BG1-RELATED-RELATED [Salix purpurea]